MFIPSIQIAQAQEMSIVRKNKKQYFFYCGQKYCFWEISETFFFIMARKKIAEKQYFFYYSQNSTRPVSTSIAFLESCVQPNLVAIGSLSSTYWVQSCLPCVIQNTHLWMRAGLSYTRHLSACPTIRTFQCIAQQLASLFVVTEMLSHLTITLHMKHYKHCLYKWEYEHQLTKLF